MNKKRIKKILSNAIKSFDGIENYKMIGLIGSMAKKGDKFGDVDLVTIGKKETHEKFKKHLIKKFKENGIKIVFLKTILKEFSIDKNSIMFHDLNYKKKEELLKNEWPTVTNTIIEDCLILYGKNLVKEKPLRKVIKENFLGPLLKWAKIIQSFKEYNVLEKHLLNISNIFKKYGFSKELNNIEEIINLDDDWKEKLVQIKKILR